HRSPGLHDSGAGGGDCVGRGAHPRHMRLARINVGKKEPSLAAAGKAATLQRTPMLAVRAANSAPPMNLHHVIRYLLIALTAMLSPTATASAQNENSRPTSTMNIPKPPATEQQPVTDEYFGQKIVDPYRWLEDGNSLETQQWASGQLAYTRSILDKLPGREKLHDRIEQLLEIGNLGATEVGGDYYFHTRRDGKQNQPVLYVRKGADGKDEVLIDANQLSKDGTIALDWWRVSH